MLGWWFFSLLGAVVGFAVWLTIDQTTSASSGATAWVALAIPLGAIVTPYLVSALHRTRCRVLLLRRFHREQNGRFEVTRCFDALVISGFDVVTLRDTAAFGDRASTRPMFWTALGLPLLALAFAAFGAVLLLIVWATVALPGLQWLVLPAAMVGTVAWSAWRPSRRIERWALDKVSRSSTAVDRLSPTEARAGDFPRDQRGALRLPRSFRRSGQLGMTVLATNDVIWKEVVEALIRWSDVICIDLAATNDNIREELRLIDEVKRAPRIVWLVPVSALDAPPIRIEGDRYTVMDRQFPGLPSVVAYPDAGASNMQTMAIRRSAVGRRVHDAILALQRSN